MSAQRDRDEDWRDFAACRGRGDLTPSFFPTDMRPKIDPRVAVLCAECPVVVECGKFGFADPERSGIWGGRIKIAASKRTAPKPSLPD